MSVISLSDIDNNNKITTKAIRLQQLTGKWRKTIIFREIINESCAVLNVW